MLSFFNIKNSKPGSNKKNITSADPAPASISNHKPSYNYTPTSPAHPPPLKKIPPPWAHSLLHRPKETAYQLYSSGTAEYSCL